MERFSGGGRYLVFDGLLDSSEQTEQKIEDIQTYRAG
jgi:hypothetical protein